MGTKSGFQTGGQTAVFRKNREKRSLSPGARRAGDYLAVSCSRVMEQGGKVRGGSRYDTARGGEGCSPPPSIDSKPIPPLRAAGFPPQHAEPEQRSAQQNECSRFRRMHHVKVRKVERLRESTRISSRRDGERREAICHHAEKGPIRD